MKYNVKCKISSELITKIKKNGSSVFNNWFSSIMDTLEYSQKPDGTSQKPSADK